MQQHRIFAILIGLTLPFTIQSSGCGDNCCKSKGGIQYCDSSAGRFVCSDGDYSSCYCTRHAVMDLQKIQGCCLWQGGVFKIDHPSGLVICNNGGISEMCSTQAVFNAVRLY